MSGINRFPDSDPLEYWEISEKLFNPEEEYLGTNKEVNKITPLVSVSITTYQHAPFIRDCLEGVLMQKTDFPVEILIVRMEAQMAPEKYASVMLTNTLIKSGFF